MRCQARMPKTKIVSHLILKGICIPSTTNWRESWSEHINWKKVANPSSRKDSWRSYRTASGTTRTWRILLLASNCRTSGGKRSRLWRSLRLCCKMSAALRQAKAIFSSYLIKLLFQITAKSSKISFLPCLMSIWNCKGIIYLPTAGSSRPWLCPTRTAALAFRRCRRRCQVLIGLYNTLSQS